MSEFSGFLEAPKGHLDPKTRPHFFLQFFVFFDILEVQPIRLARGDDKTNRDRHFELLKSQKHALNIFTGCPQSHFFDDIWIFRFVYFCFEISDILEVYPIRLAEKNDETNRALHFEFLKSQIEFLKSDLGFSNPMHSHE